MQAGWLDIVATNAHHTLIGGKSEAAASALNYLTSRGVTGKQIFDNGIGYADPTVPITACTKEFADWVTKYWSNRLVFPVRSPLGAVIGLQTRSLQDKMYMQFWSQPTEIYAYMFGLDLALPEIWRTRQMVIVEGVFDCLAVSQVVPNVVAVMTAKASIAVKRFIRRYVKRVTALFDMDEPGRAGAETLRRFATGYGVVIPTYSEHDPGDMVKRGKLPELQRILQYVGDAL